MSKRVMNNIFKTTYTYFIDHSLNPQHFYPIHRFIGMEYFTSLANYPGIIYPRMARIPRQKFIYIYAESFWDNLRD